MIFGEYGTAEEWKLEVVAMSTHSSAELTTKTSLTQWALIAMLTGLAAFGTVLIRIPVPATTGYFNIGDVFVVWAGLWLGPLGGLIVGAIGPTIADAIGFPQFILATAVTKGLEGLIVGLLAYRSKGVARKVIAAAVGSTMIVVGCFSFEAYIYPKLGSGIPFFAVTDLGAATVEILPNLVQAVIGAAVGVALWRATSGYSVGEKVIPKAAGKTGIL
ncbi:MAG: ECF transporter S component [Bryobacterales bacterium]|nr:ECF transporter S component [Bryobacterales bacterium]